MNSWQAFWNWYFEPKPFESFREGLIYRWLGIRFYKRYLPTSGDIVSQWRGERRIPAYSNHTELDLLRYEQTTRSYEGRHIFGAIVMLMISWWSIAIYDKGDWVTLVIANMLINGYPIMLQRYNRIRLRTLLSRIHKHSRPHHGRLPNPLV